MNIQELLDILNNKHEIPSPEHAELCFYFKKDDDSEITLKLDSIGAFNISTDITFTFSEDKEPVMMKPVSVIKPMLQKGGPDEQGY